MHYKLNPEPPRLMTDFKSKNLDEQVEDTVYSAEIMSIIEGYVLQ